ncbi:hypothetical protein ABT354_28990 [Streptomyces sp. NPDC000594]|uniref:hypothetical protein n=1 Tax=Streptomyces sp. NPDC000594 TaxID=3154261 RepID=UPI00332D6BD2
MQRLAYARREGRRAHGGRKALYAPGVAAALIAVVVGAVATGCTAGSDDGGTEADAKSGTARTVAQPGKYRTLLEPCGAVDRSTLRELLPGLDALAEEERGERLRGEAAPTFDTDRRVGCSWQARTAEGVVHTLTLDFERVVSYDAAISDNDQAQQVFEAKRDAALPEDALPAATGTPTGGSSDPATTDGATGDGTGDEPDLSSRVLDDLGDDAFLHDEASAPGGPTADRRNVSVVFRTSNVVATVDYSEQTGRATSTPDGEELQDRATNLADELVGEFDE